MVASNQRTDIARLARHQSAHSNSAPVPDSAVTHLHEYLIDPREKNLFAAQVRHHARRSHRKRPPDTPKPARKAELTEPLTRPSAMQHI